MESKIPGSLADASFARGLLDMPPRPQSASTGSAVGFRAARAQTLQAAGFGLAGFLGRRALDLSTPPQRE
jgi:hypothetical protein